MTERLASARVGVLGATSLVGGCLLPRLLEAGWSVTAYSRRALGQHDNGVAWRRLQVPASSPSQPLEYMADQKNTTLSTLRHDTVSSQKGRRRIPYWVCLAPVWVVPEHFSLLEAEGARRLVLLSSTSRFTKLDSVDSNEHGLALRLVEAEEHVREWAANCGVEWVILRPTLIYGLGLDKNISEIARIIRLWGWAPLVSRATGLRQPVHAADVAAACLAALRLPSVANRAYNISGGEILTYRQMVIRVFASLGRRPRLLTLPLWVFRSAVALLRCLPRYRYLSGGMIERMGRDMVFDHSEAARDLGFTPRRFHLAAEDLSE